MTRTDMQTGSHAHDVAPGAGPGAGVTRRRALAGAAGLAGAAAVAGLAASLRPLAGAGVALADGSAAQEGSSFIYATTSYGVQMEDAGLNPRDGYCGWSCLRYGVGETLFRFDDAMTPQPWLATAYEFVDETHCKIDLREGVSFTSGRALDGEAVAQCLQALVDEHPRAAGDLKISSVAADGMSVTVETSEPCPALINYLCDPYGCVVDVDAGVDEQAIVAGTGPFKAVSRTDDQIELVANQDYWGEAPQVDRIVVRAVSDGDTLTAALQSGQVDATYGLPYASYALFENDGFNIASCSTSRSFFLAFNFSSDVCSDQAVRKAICMGVDRQGFVDVLLNGRGEPARCVFPESMPFGGDAVDVPGYDSDGARAVLEEAGWVDSDGDGVREKDGRKLTVRWLTYPGRMELPLLAESAQATLRDIGIDVEVNSTANHADVRTDRGAWDVYASAMVTAPTGDPEYFFNTHCLDASSHNEGGYHSDRMEELVEELHQEFDQDRRTELAVEIQQQMADDDAFMFVSFLTMGIVSRAGIGGLQPHPCDYYEVSSDLTVE